MTKHPVADFDNQPGIFGHGDEISRIDYLAIAIANSCALLDPDLVILRSGLDLYTDLLIEPILRRIEYLVPTRPQLVASKLGYKATALGAIVEVLYDTNNFYSIRKLR